MKFNNSYILSIASLIIALSIAYYFVIFLPEKERSKLNLELKEQEARTEKQKINSVLLDDCLNDVGIRMNNSWNEVCKAKGLKEDCLQSLDVVEIHDKRNVELKNECFKKYPQK